MNIDSKLPGIGTSIFTLMSQLARETGAINLAQGFPGFEPPTELRKRVGHYLEHGANQYAPANGVPSLLNAVAEKIRREYLYQPDVGTELTICTGATEGMFSTVAALIRSGDEVIVFDPAYDAYEPAIRLAGGIPVHVPLARSDGEFFVDWQRLDDALTARTRAVIVNFPHNPTGALLSANDLDTLADLLEPTSTLVFSDEVYEHIVFNGLRHQSLVGHERLRSRSVVISSFGKTFHATGWKLGYVWAPAVLTDEFRKVHQFATFSVSTPMQHALADFMQANPDYYAQLSVFYAAKRDAFARLLDQTRLAYTPTRSTFFQCVDFSAVSDLDDVAMAMHLTQEVGVAAIPLSVFCEDDFPERCLRLCFAKDNKELERAADRLATL